MWVLAKSSTEHVYSLEIYTGKGTERHLSVGEHVVMSFIDGMDLKNRQLFFDSYFNSVQLLYQVRKQNFSCWYNLFR